MNQEPVRVPIQKGKNKPINYKTLEINPVNLFIQERHWNEASTHIELELKIKDNNKFSHAYLGYNEKGAHPLTNYPQVFGNYIYSLEIKQDDAVTFVIDELDFGIPFFIELGKEAQIENLTVKFIESRDVMGRALEGANSYSYAKYTLLVIENKDEKEFSFSSLNFDEQEHVLYWKNYEMKVLHTEIRSLKLVVSKK